MRWHLCVLCGVYLVLLASPLSAQELQINFGEDGSVSARVIQLFALVTVLSLAPAIAIMITCFPFILTVLSILRQAIGLQASPPNMLIVSLSLFLTYFIMEPVFVEAWEIGVEPLLNEEIDIEIALARALDPFRVFMSNRVDLSTYQSIATLRPDSVPNLPDESSPLSVLIPSFLLSEISRAFQIGFLIFLPFLIIDLVVAAILMSMGMMMVPPAIISLPFKLAFFVVADGWNLIATNLVQSYF